MSMRRNELLNMRDMAFLFAGIGIGWGVWGWLMTVEKNFPTPLVVGCRKTIRTSFDGHCVIMLRT